MFFVCLTASLALGCSSGVEVTLNLMNPCGAEDMLKDCSFIQMSVSSLDPSDPLHPDKIVDQQGPIGWSCDFAQGKCSLNGDLLLGVARVVDVRCLADMATPPLTRATSQAMLLDKSGELGTMNLLMGNINGFIPTTVLEDNASPASVGTCSVMGQGSVGRYGHTSTLLADGRVLITGGIRKYGQVEEILATVEIFDPQTGQHRLLTAADGSPLKMRAMSGRAFHTATVLRTGKVLLAGGIGLLAGKKDTLISTEIFDPDTETFPEQWVNQMGSHRAYHTATALVSGEVLISGGASVSNGTISAYHDTAVIYNPDTNTWQAVANTMSTARAFHQAVQLSNADNNNIVIIGGENGAGTHNTIDLFDVTNREFYAGVDSEDTRMHVNRSHFSAVLMANGNVLVSGGTSVLDGEPTSLVEIFEPGSKAPFGAFRVETLSLAVARKDHSSTLLDTGNVLIAGGQTATHLAVGVGELVLVGAQNYSVLELTDDFLDPPRFLHTAVRLRNGWVYLAGGLPSLAPDDLPITQSVLFVPRPAW